jgi:VWFA-related protein
MAWQMVIAAFAVTTAAELCLHAQTFRSATALVHVTATVLDKKGNPALGLTKQDFTVFEDGKPQEIAFFSAAEQPISMALVVDTSGSMVDKIEDVRDAVLHFIDALRPGDEVFLLRFSTDVEVLTEPGDNPDRVRRAVERLRPSGGTALFDSVVESLDAIRRGRHQKKAVLLITDGNDNSSRMRQRDAVEAARTSEVLVYGLGIGHGERGSFGHDVFGQRDRVDIALLERLSEQTGGRSYLLEEAHRKGVDLIDQAVQQIGQELRQQYSVGYYPTNTAADGTFRKIEVKVSSRDYRVRAKSSYVATAKHR